MISKSSNTTVEGLRSVVQGRREWRPLVHTGTKSRTETAERQDHQLSRWSRTWKGEVIFIYKCVKINVIHSYTVPLKIDRSLMGSDGIANVGFFFNKYKSLTLSRDDFHFTAAFHLPTSKGFLISKKDNLIDRIICNFSLPSNPYSIFVSSWNMKYKYRFRNEQKKYFARSKTIPV